MERYNPNVRICLTDGHIGVMSECESGEYVEYEDVQALVQWMKDVAEEWKNSPILQYSLYDEGLSDAKCACGEMLKQKLREIGEL